MRCAVPMEFVIVVYHRIREAFHMHVCDVPMQFATDTADIPRAFLWCPLEPSTCTVCIPSHAQHCAFDVVVYRAPCEGTYGLCQRELKLET